MRQLPAPTQEQAGALIAMLAVMFGGWVRLMIPGMAGFPVNDGGLFYVMLRAVQANGLRIPATVQYNGLDIPFAYPPLGFYAGALVMNTFRVDAIRLLQWLPAVVLVATLPAFYVLARAVLGTSFRAGLATLMFAFAPRAITWQVMGGGLTRSFGQLFMILALAFIYRTFVDYRRRHLVLAALFGGLVVLSHPEAALQTAGIAILMWLAAGRTMRSALHAVSIAGGTVLISAAWWLPAILRHGVGTLASASQTGLYSLLALLHPFLLNFVDEPLMSIVAVLGMIGFVLECARRRFLIPLWLFAPFLFEPRSAPTAAVLPMAMLAALALTEIILPAVAGLGMSPPAAADLMRRLPVMLFLGFVSVFMLGDVSVFAAQLSGTALSRGSRTAFSWIRTHTPPGSRFLVLTGNTEAELFCDATLEWFPALSERANLTTVQGREWLGSGSFLATAAVAQNLSACPRAESPLACVEGTRLPSGAPLEYDYIYIARRTPLLIACSAVGSTARGERLISELKQSSHYAQVYADRDAAVFRLR